MKDLGKKMMVIIMILCMSTSLLVGCGDSQDNDTEVVTENEATEIDNEEEEIAEEEESKSKYDTLVVGTDDLNAVFNPFFASTHMDTEVVERVHYKLYTNDRGGAPADGLATYETPVEVKDSEGNITHTVYTFKLKEGLKFSDGEPVTADDVIFSYKVYCDPTYDGSTTLYTTPIVGIKEYRYDDPNYKEEVDKLRQQADDITKQEVLDYIMNSCESDFNQYGVDVINDYTGFTNPENLEGDQLKEASVKAYYDKEVAEYYDDYVPGAIESKFKSLEKAYIDNNIAGGTVNVPDIEGIKKIDELTVEVTIEGVDPKAIWNLAGIEVAPEHYYSVGKDGATFKKGDLSVIREKNDKPIGAGPYTFEKFENNVVSLVANPYFFKGKPKVPKIKYQVVATANTLESVILGEMDITAPTASPERVQEVKDAGIHYELIDNLGYGYIGINSERITDLNVRKGLMHLMNREPAINTYYSELASVIERPMSKVSWAYPEDAKAIYPFNPEKALEYFLAAGYEQVTKDSKTILEKDGKQLRVEIGIAGDGIMDHPSAPILTQMKTELEKIGGELIINDCDGAILFDRLDAGEWDMWVAAWQATIDPDMFQVYHSSGPTNHYRIKSDELDQVIVDARSTNDIKVRKELYSRALDIIMEQAVEMPVYQRKNMYIFNPEVVNVDTLPKDMTPFYEHFEEIETLELR